MAQPHHSHHAAFTTDAPSDLLQREIFELLSDCFGVYFSTVQIETECLESAAAAAIDYSARPESA